MSANRPKLIVITPVRNEAWVLEAFLTCTSSWADHIIIADQHSTDGSREIASNFNKVILVDNDATEMNQAAARLMLFQEVDKIEGDKIIFALDADEFLSAGFEKTDGWNRIITSKPNEIFCFKWINLYGDYLHALPESDYMEWAFHFEPSIRIASEYERFEKNAIHESRVPCRSVEEVDYVEINDIRFIHLANLNPIRQKNKTDFYQVHTIADRNERISVVGLYRTHTPSSAKVNKLEEEIKLKGMLSNLDAKGLVRMGDVGIHYINEMVSLLKRDGIERYLKLNIWDNQYLQDKGFTPNIPFYYRVLHWYLRKTQRITNSKSIEYVDKILKHLI